MVISRPFSARLRFQDANYDSVQTFTRVHPNMIPVQVQLLTQAVNAIRRPAEAATGGFYTVMEELVDVS
jgi:hypothetical protein